MNDMSLGSQILSRETGPDKLVDDELRELVDRITRDVRHLSEGFCSAIDAQRHVADEHRVESDSCARTNLQMDVRRARNLRNLRRRLFGSENSCGPAWDVLLHLFESHACQRRDTIGKVCDGATIPCTTAIRWISRLEEQGLVGLRDDPLDRRRRFVELTSAGAELMSKYFSGASSHLLAA
jgi:DNA-binding MarR family transcriptional regulator